MIGFVEETKQYVSYVYNIDYCNPHDADVSVVHVVIKDCYSNYECDHQCNGCANSKGFYVPVSELVNQNTIQSFSPEKHKQKMLKVWSEMAMELLGINDPEDTDVLEMKYRLLREGAINLIVSLHGHRRNREAQTNYH